MILDHFSAGREPAPLAWVERVEPGVGGNLLVVLRRTGDGGDVAEAVGAVSGSAEFVTADHGLERIPHGLI